jgi:AAA+ ATPase superfamily predicted ATPase
MFLARTRELEFLEELFRSPRAEMFVLYGRRRVGKTELLQQFCSHKRSAYFLAAQVREKDNLRAFRDALARGSTTRWCRASSSPIGRRR